MFVVLGGAARMSLETKDTFELTVGMLFEGCCNIRRLVVMLVMRDDDELKWMELVLMA